MRSKRKLLNAAKLYLILDRQVNSYEELFDIARYAIAAGVDLMQLRDKEGTAKEILDFSRKILTFCGDRVPYIINDRVDLALASGAWGVHLGQDDIPVPIARKILGSKAIIGASCQTVAHLKKAVQDGADYVGFGSIFKTQTKPQRSPMDLENLKKIARKSPIPFFAIGGITLNRMKTLMAKGVGRVAVCRAICGEQNITRAVTRFKEELL